MGAETWVTLEVAGARVVGHAAAEFAGGSGDAAWAVCEAGKVMRFDKETGVRRGG